jgi:hypothetical protein
MRRVKANLLIPNGIRVAHIGDLDEADPFIRFDVDAKEAERLVRASQGRRFCVASQQFIARIDQTDAAPGVILGRDVTAYVSTTRAGTLTYMTNAYRYVRRGFYIRISFSNYCFFVG